ncbi:BrnA antitoxin family protein [Aquamicrobium sp. LC103]|uniref:BrnA antitoxin family protein n=1 Tax=Aquamicrobium sp. LC103 TaxID=1120658 RepID=UPI00063E8873|nr:BrnA antitoxin family protein [Aquamicrobium sp. LC103]TKT80952.1 BrnA antitoxin family protein [Aquamicrobium sp. LC103]
MASRKTLKQFVPGRGYSKKDWDAVDSPELTDEELGRMRLAREVLPPGFFETLEKSRQTRGRPPLDNPKKQVTLRLDADVVERFRAEGPGWQSRINEALRKAAGL